MTIYVVQLFLLAAFAFVFRVRGINQRFWYLTLSFSTLMIFVAARAYSIGTDTTTYFWVFTYVRESPSFMESFAASRITAPVYVAYNWLIAFLFGDYRVVLIVNSFIVGFGIARFIYKSSSNAVVSTILFVLLAFYFQSMNGMRQYVAIAFVVNAYLSFSEKGVMSIGGWILFVLAVGVHTTALALAPAILCLILMRNTRDTKCFIGIMGIIAMACALSLRLIVSMFIALFPYYGMYDGETNIDFFSSDYGGRIIYLYLVFFAMVFAAFVLMKPDKQYNRNDMVTVLFPLVVFGVFIGLAFPQSFLINRVLWFYTIAFVSFIPNAIQLMKKEACLLANIGVLAIFSLWWIAQLLEDQHDVIPFILG